MGSLVVVHRLSCSGASLESSQTRNELTFPALTGGFFYIYIFIYLFYFIFGFMVFVVAHGLSLVVASRGYSPVLLHEVCMTVTSLFAEDRL